MFGQAKTGILDERNSMSKVAQIKEHKLATLPTSSLINLKEELKIGRRPHEVPSRWVTTQVLRHKIYVQPCLGCLKNH